MRRRARARDAEQDQTVVRLALGSIVVFYMLTSGSEALPADVVLSVRWLAGLFLLASALLLVAASHGIGPAFLRRGFGIVLDIAATSLTMAMAGESGAPLLGVYLWVIVGNGFRYDSRYLAFATTLSLIGFSLAALQSPYWHAHPFFAVSYLLVLLIIPAYVGALLGKLRRAMREAEQASLAKSRFLAKMSHELRTPLNGIIGLSDLLLDGKLHGQERDFVNTILASSRTLLGIIESILDFSKIEAGRLRMATATLEIPRLVHENLAMFSAEARRKGITLDAQLDPKLPPGLRGDPLHIRQVLINLLGNAVKFTDAGQVTVRVVVAERGASPDTVPVRFEVEDTGIGIGAADQPHIFDSFRQGTAATARHYGGTGLGTAIARELVQLMGGRIGFHSSVGVGSLFWFELPLARLPEAVDDGACMPVQLPQSQVALAAESQGSTPADGLWETGGRAWRAPGADHETIISLAEHHRRQLQRRLRVLVAEDNDANRQVVRAVLERAGHRLLVVEDGEAALHALAEDDEGLDLLVLDKNMPGRGGLEVFRAQRFMCPDKPIPTIILSADATETAVAEARAAGVDAYLTKPVMGRQLLDSVASIVRAPGAAAAAPDPVKPAGAGVDGRAAAAGRMARTEPILDPDKLASLRQLDAGSGFFDELVRGFRQDAEAAVAGIAAALAAEDYQSLRRAMHALEGSAAEVGAAQLVAAVRRLRCLRPFELDSPGARELLADVEGVVPATLRALEQPAAEVPACRGP